MMQTAFADSEVLGAVLAGGASRRMGRDKAFLQVGGRPLICRPLAALRSVLDEVVIVAPRRRRYERLTVEVVPDLRAGLGPVGGLQAALVHAEGRPVFLLGCDMPFVSGEVVRCLLSAPGEPSGSAAELNWRRHAVARVPVDRGRPQPLCGLYGGGCLPAVEQALRCGPRSALGLLVDLQTELVELDEAASWYHPHLFMNVNDRDDYGEVEALLAGSAMGEG